MDRSGKGNELTSRRPQPGPAPDDLDQIAERLRWTPRERLRYLLDMLDFEERARRARRLPREG